MRDASALFNKMNMMFKRYLSTYSNRIKCTKHNGKNEVQNVLNNKKAARPIIINKGDPNYKYFRGN